MKMKNHIGEELKIKVSGYMLLDSHGVLYNSDWLKTELLIISKDQNYKRELEFLTIEELERIIFWLELIQGNQMTIKRLDFVDPTIFFLLVRRGGLALIKLVNADYDKSYISWDLQATTENLNNFICQLKNLVLKFPCRCGQKHDLT